MRTLQISEGTEVAQVEAIRNVLSSMPTNLYGILQVAPGDSYELLRAQYRKLVLLLHPDKDKFAGAERAFKLVGEAWAVLSDSSKRQAYDRRILGKLQTQHRDRSSFTQGNGPANCRINNSTAVSAKEMQAVDVPIKKGSLQSCRKVCGGFGSFPSSYNYGMKADRKYVDLVEHISRYGMPESLLAKNGCFDTTRSRVLI